jgi:hypothetical protein
VKKLGDYEYVQVMKWCFFGIVASVMLFTEAITLSTVTLIVMAIICIMTSGRRRMKNGN